MNLLKFAIDLGHGVGQDGGAVEIMAEEDAINEVGKRVINKLKMLGHSVIETRPSKASSVRDSLKQRCQTSDNAKVDFFVSLHANAAPNEVKGKANGTECYAISEDGRQLAFRICREIAALGYFNRGVKNGNHLYVVRETEKPAVLIEMFFLDSKKDCLLYDPEHMANAIVLGLCGKTPNIADKAA